MLVQNNLVAFRSALFYKKPVADAAETQNLSSGHGLSRTANDAAALEVSSRMRRQIDGLNRESAEVQNNISLTQVAEEGLSKTSEILQRINSLSVKAVSNEISVAERNTIHAEIRDLLGELDKIARSTSFDNKLYPLRGDEGMTGEEIKEVEEPVVEEEPYTEEYVESRMASPIKFIDATSQGLDISSIEVATSEDASFYNMKVENALNTVNTYKSVLGIVRSRLEDSLIGRPASVPDYESTQPKPVFTDEVEIEEPDIDYISNSLANILNNAEQAMMSQRSKDGSDVLALLEV